jgi:hypothetical protein
MLLCESVVMARRVRVCSCWRQLPQGFSVSLIDDLTDTLMMATTSSCSMLAASAMKKSVAIIGQTSSRAMKLMNLSRRNDMPRWHAPIDDCGGKWSLCQVIWEE